jgi:5,10-methylenetetrahydromethanopterin reductase
VVAFWLGTFPIPGRAADLARMAEADGWDGLAFTDSQNLGGDTFAALAIAAHVTERITLATGATNPATRHPAVIASAIATIQVESHGRAFLGIARGDSALAYIGRKPLPVLDFARALAAIQAYLRGEAVDCDGFASRLQ